MTKPTRCNKSQFSLAAVIAIAPPLSGEFGNWAKVDTFSGTKPDRPRSRAAPHPIFLFADPITVLHDKGSRRLVRLRRVDVGSGSELTNS
jgi:hypothetical protein